MEKRKRKAAARKAAVPLAPPGGAALPVIVDTVDPPRARQGVVYVADDNSREWVKIGLRAGLIHEQIAQCLGISVDTLTRHYPNELSSEAALANARVANTLYQKALRGDVTAMIFYLKSRAGWREKSPYDAENPIHVKTDAGPLVTEIVNALRARRLGEAEEIEHGIPKEITTS